MRFHPEWESTVFMEPFHPCDEMQQEYHLPGQHDQKAHGRGGGGGDATGTDLWADLETVQAGIDFKAAAKYKEAESLLRTHGIKYRQLRNLDPDVVMAASQQLVELQRDYRLPEGATLTLASANLHAEQTYARCSTLGTAHIIRLNTQRFSPDKAARTRQSIAFNALTGYHPEYRDPVKGIVAHEYGHAVYTWAVRRGSGRLPSPEEAREESGAKPLTRYGKKNKGEHFCESFSQRVQGTQALDRANNQWVDAVFEIAQGGS